MTGPPRAICSLNFGITLPDEPSTLPKRTAMNRVQVVEKLLAAGGRAVP